MGPSKSDSPTTITIAAVFAITKFSRRAAEGITAKIDQIVTRKAQGSEPDRETQRVDREAGESATREIGPTRSGRRSATRRA